MTLDASARAKIEARLEKLTRRELQAVELVAAGFLVKQAADAMRISEAGFKFHLRNVRRKIGWGKFECIAFYPIPFGRYEELRKEHKVAA